MNFLPRGSDFKVYTIMGVEGSSDDKTDVIIRIQPFQKCIHTIIRFRNFFTWDFRISELRLVSLM